MNVCDGTRLVCKKHSDRPASGKYECGCGGPSVPCSVCSKPKGGLREPEARSGKE